VVEVAADGTAADLNDAALRMFGVDRREVAGKPIAETLVPERLRTRFAEALADWLGAAREGRPIDRTETTMTRADGSEFPAAVTIASVAGAEPPRLTLYVRNLAVQDRAEAARREADERFERLFHDGAAAAVLIDMQGLLTLANPAFCKLADRTTAQLIGREATDVLRDAGDAHEAPWQGGAERPGPLMAARRIERPDGRAVTVQITASLVRDGAGVPIHWICQCAPRTIADVAALPDGEALSYRERQVLGLLARGLDGPAIAERLGLAQETVRSYAGSAREKIGAKTRTEAVALALARGEITL
jgi:PAS domain S-box-containing protein